MVLAQPRQLPSILKVDSTLKDLINYEPPVINDELIVDVMNYLLSPKIASKGYVPLKDSFWGEGYAGARIPFVQQALLINEGRVIPLRYVFSNQPINDYQILNYLLGRIGNSWPVYVEQINSDPNARLGWLRKHFQRKAYGFIVQSGDQIKSHFNKVLRPKRVVNLINHYGFSEEKNNDMKVIYSLFSELLPGNELFFHNGSLLNDSISFSFDFKDESSNFVINPESEEGVDSVIYINPYAGNNSLVDLEINSSTLHCLKKYLK